MKTKITAQPKPAAKTRAMDPKNYPRIRELGLVVVDDGGVPVVPWHELKRVLSKEKLDEFGRFFGVQTCSPLGLYAWDVSAVLERMRSGRVVGTQACWD